MTTVIFETESAIFQFNLPDVKEILVCHSIEGQVQKAATILKNLETAKGAGKIPIENEFFGYIVLDLLSRGKGSAFCKSCKKTFQASQLQSFPLGFGESPLFIKLKEKGGWFNRLFGQKIKGMGMFGGKAFQCPNGHELISMITWIS
jgi:hypothetical protein